MRGRACQWEGATDDAAFGSNAPGGGVRLADRRRRDRPEADQSLWNRAEPLVSDQQTYRARSQRRRSAPSDRCRACGGQARKTGLDPSANSRSHLVFFGHRRTWFAAAGPRHASSQVRGGCREQGATVPGANASIDRRRLHRSREPRAPAPPLRAFRRRLGRIGADTDAPIRHLRATPIAAAPAAPVNRPPLRSAI